MFSSSPQLRLSTYLVRTALSWFTIGLTFGLFVQFYPYPRLALTAHIQWMVNGLFYLGLGLLLRTDIVQFRAGEIRYLRMCLDSNWLVLVFETLNAWWGTQIALPLAAYAAGVLPGTAKMWQEVLMVVSHLPPSAGLIYVAASFAWKSFAEVEDAADSEKDK